MNLQKDQAGGSIGVMAAANIGTRTTNQRTNMLAMLKKQNMQKRS